MLIPIRKALSRRRWNRFRFFLDLEILVSDFIFSQSTPFASQAAPTPTFKVPNGRHCVTVEPRVCPPLVRKNTNEEYEEYRSRLFLVFLRHREVSCLNFHRILLRLGFRVAPMGEQTRLVRGALSEI